MKTGSKSKYVGDKVEFKQAEDGKGNGVFVKKGNTIINQDDVVMDIPLELCLFAKFTDDDEASGRGVALPAEVLKSPVLKAVSSMELAMALLFEYAKGPQSFFAPYLAILPTTFDSMPITWSNEELLLIPQDSNSFVIFSRIADISLAYCVLCEDAATSKVVGTYENFFWGACVVNSRQNMLPSKTGSLKKLALVPAYDMCNHDPHGTKITTEFSWETRTYQCRAHKSFSEGEEFTIFYGPRPDLELLLYSGYVCSPPGANEHSALILRFSIQSTPELLKIKQVLVNGIPGITETADSNFYLLDIGGVLRDKALRAFARAAAVKTREEAQIALKKKLTPKEDEPPLTDAEKEYCKLSLQEHQQKLENPTTTASTLEKCRPTTIRVADELRKSNLAVLERTLTQCLS